MRICEFLRNEFNRPPVIERRGKTAAKGCRTQIKINDYRYDGIWPSNWEKKQDILESEELELFNFDCLKGTITFMIGSDSAMDLSLDECKNKIITIKVTSDNAEGTSDEKTVSEIMQCAKEVRPSDLPITREIRA